jgi:hypothetical protein
MSINRRIRYADVMSTLAAFVALGGVGYAAATLPANSVGSKQIKKGAVTSSDVRNGSLARDDFRNGVLPTATSGTDGTNGGDGASGSDGSDGAQGPIGPEGPQGPMGLTGPPGDQGPAGTARAYATVNPSCPGNACTVALSKDIASVTRVSTGNYCVWAPGISSEFVPAYAAVEYTTTPSPQAAATAVASNDPSQCSEGHFLVVTRRLGTETVKNTSNATVTVSSGTDAAANNVGFTVLIP